MISALRPDAAPHSLTLHACFEDQEVMGEVMRVLWIGNTEVRVGVCVCGGKNWLCRGQRLEASGAETQFWKRWESETGSSVEGQRHGNIEDLDSWKL